MQIKILRQPLQFITFSGQLQGKSEACSVLFRKQLRKNLQKWILNGNIWAYIFMNNTGVQRKSARKRHFQREKKGEHKLCQIR